MELSNFTSAILYLAIFAASICLAYLGQKKCRKSLIALAIILPVLLAGFRFNTGTDSAAYQSYYNDFGNEAEIFDLEHINTGGMEPFIVLVTYAGRLLNFNVSFLYIVFAAITCGFFYAIARMYDKERAWLYFGVLLLIVFPESMNMMRQVAAISVQAFTLLYLYRAKSNQHRIHWLGVISLLLFSVGLHYSSIILLPTMLLPFISNRKHWRSLGVILGALAVLCVFSFPKLVELIASSGIVPEKHLYTLTEMSDGSFVNIKFAGALFLTLALAANYRRHKNINDRQMAFLMLLGTSYAAVGFYSGYLGRLAMLFWIFILLIGMDLICQLFQKEHHRSAVCMAVAFGYFVIYFCVLGFNQIMPYCFAMQ